MELGKVIGKGRTANVYEYGTDTIVKLLNSGFSNSVAEKEARIHTVVQDCGLPVPKLYDVVMVEGRKGLIYQRINGVSMLESIRNAPNMMPKYANDLASLHLDIGSCSIQDDGLETVKKRYAGWISAVDELAEAEKEKVISNMEELPEGDTLCHCDFHPDNVLIDNGKYYIIDWLTAAKGLFCTDVMRSHMLIKYGSQADDMDITPEMKMGIELFGNIYMDGILKSGRLNIDDVFRWEIPVLAARLYEGVPNGEKKVILERLYQLL